MDARAEVVVNGAWALRLPASSSPAAAALRTRTDVFVCDAPDGCWLRGERVDRELRRLLARLPGGEPFERLADGRVVRPGGRVPAATMPAGPWLAIAARFAPALPVAALPAVAPTGVLVRLVRATAGDAGASEFEATGVPALATTIGELRAWCDHAPQLRCRGLVFATAADGRTLVVGAPLPPVRGDVLVVVDGIVVPAGHVLAPACPPALLRAHLALAPGDLALLQTDGRCVLLPASAFVAMTRSAVRATAAATTMPATASPSTMGAP